MKKIVGVLLLSCLLVGCDKPKIDSSTDAAMKSSIAKVRDSLPENKREEFDNALKVVAFSNINMADLMRSTSNNDNEEISKKMRESLSGKTGEEIISYAQQVTAEREMKLKEKMTQEIKALEEKKADADVAKKELMKIQVLSSRFTMEPEQDGKPQPVIRLVVKNNSDTVISRAYLHGVMASEGYSVPWLVSNFFYDIPEGLKPNEEATWAIAPPKNSEWGVLYAPKDAVLTVTLVRVDGTDNQMLYDATIFTEEDNSRLEELKRKISDL
ncbi:DUF6694 family lipoprotein [Enterococcus sp. A8]|uniref:DUF6694 family lipoprotein n=1 Tax=Enterobacter sp. A8 TaxID=2507249 RepID=UPI00102F0D61|nr:DUF6694 family lipoprotein [Enterobacter sp. A8]